MEKKAKIKTIIKQINDKFYLAYIIPEGYFIGYKEYIIDIPLLKQEVEKLKKEIDNFIRKIGETNTCHIRWEDSCLDIGGSNIEYGMAQCCYKCQLYKSNYIKNYEDETNNPFD
jgi:hypothetical protein